MSEPEQKPSKVIYSCAPTPKVNLSSRAAIAQLMARVANNQAQIRLHPDKQRELNLGNSGPAR